MKVWSTDHPKAKLMARKRGDILAAAKASFLATGYGGTSMESIAKTANVSIMTLYRHAENKDDLFAAVISNACAPVDEAERAELEGILRMPLPQALVESAIHMQKVLVEDDNIALLRVVVAEAPRFPQLAELAYAGFIGRLEDRTAWMLSEIPQTSGLTERERRRLGGLFVERIVGPELLCALLGLRGPTGGDQRRRAERARDDVLREMNIS
ncbi:transcriptional regulator, TetR family [Paraburkholderia fungorum]|uniref:Transcriptional regulator, TetR family n=1 Tax=Paraburkholderia fungorum TaxID=134537 RepID=A0A1H1JXN7_9BURK|nr:TetR/AcrR family transcriptional regulator [Paraburkholderia fungorum]SDR54818.1 transcriptional regulator, TetR family [Paraburkholderia fungorum]